MIPIDENIRAYWNGRAGLGQWAGSRDVIAKQLEIRAIAAYVRDGMKILDVGCGNGITAIELARTCAVDITGLDFAEEMVVAARDLANSESLRGTVRFEVGDVHRLSSDMPRFDLIYTERTLINLPDWNTQKAVILRLFELLSPGGFFVMCENSQDGLDQINEWRRQSGLPDIMPPWHNHYFRDECLAKLSTPGITLEKVDCYSSTYYFLSRVVNAWLAKREGKDPEYEAAVNQLALLLPPIGPNGQGKIWLWRKTL